MQSAIRCGGRPTDVYCVLHFVHFVHIRHYCSHCRNTDYSYGIGGAEFDYDDYRSAVDGAEEEIWMTDAKGNYRCKDYDGVNDHHQQ